MSVMVGIVIVIIASGLLVCTTILMRNYMRHLFNARKDEAGIEERRLGLETKQVELQIEKEKSAQSQHRYNEKQMEYQIRDKEIEARRIRVTT